MTFNTKKKKKFNKKDWSLKRASRIYLVDDLVRRELLLKLNKKEVLETLGDECNDINSNSWRYYIGEKFWFVNFKKYNLWIQFCDMEKVKSVYVQ
jgi:hypothetical protein